MCAFLTGGLTAQRLCACHRDNISGGSSTRDISQDVLVGPRIGLTRSDIVLVAGRERLKGGWV